MHVNRRKFGIGVLGLSVVSVVVGVVGCAAGSGDGTAASQKNGAKVESIQVAVSHPEAINGLMWKIGQSKGFFEKAGVIVEKVLPAEGGGATLQAVISGNLPFGQVAPGALVTAFNEGAPIRVIAGATQSPYEIGWGVEADAAPRTVKDLANVTWGFTNSGSLTEAMSYLVPLYAGLPMDSVKRVSTGGVGAGVALLEAGGVGVTYVPPELEAAKSKDLRIVARSSDFVPVYQNTMIVSSRNYAQEHPETTKALIEGSINAIAWIKQNPDEAGEIYAKSAELDPAVGIRLVKQYIKVDLWGLAFNPEALKTAAEGLKYTDGLDSVNWKELLTDEFLPAGQKGHIPE